MLKGKTVVLGVTGSIAAYKIAGLASMLVKLHADVHVIMTENATHFINPITFETLTGNKCLVDTFDRNFMFHVAHVSLAGKADVMLVAPASANVIGKIAGGIADDMLTTTVMACTAPVLISPAMNVHMYENKILQDNLRKLREFGYQIIEPEVGFLACRDVGAGKMPSEQVLLDYIKKEIACEKDFAGEKILITAGATREAIDPVRFLTNHSTGKMGFAIAERAMLRGAEVTLVCAHTEISPPPFVKVIRVESAREMYEAVKENLAEQDVVIKTAAVADYRPATVAAEKIKKGQGDLSLALERTEDILSYIGSVRKNEQFICGFSMETENLLENSREKLKKKNIDMIVANNLKEEGAGFGTDTNIVTLITETEEQELPCLSKEETGSRILDFILKERRVGIHDKE